MRGARAGRPGLAGGDAPARRRGRLARDDRPVGRGLHRPARTTRRERRIIRPLTWVRSEPGEHGYARPIEGLVVVVDLDRMEVVEVADHGVVELPPKPGNYDPERMADPDNVPSFGAQRSDLKPIEITQPEGAELHGRRPRRRLAEVARAGRLHPARRARPARALRRRAADHLPRFAGRDVRPLRRPGADAPLQERLRPGRVRRRLARQPAHARLRLRRRDPLLRRRCQRPGRRAGGDRNAVCMHEEDFGIGWKHTDFRTEDGGGAAAAAAGDSSSRPSATTSTGTSGTSTPMARSRSRSSSGA